MHYGIDYSLSCPCITLMNKKDDKFSNCQIFYLTNHKKSIGIFDNITGKEMPLYKSQMERYEIIADWTLSVVKNCDFGCIEDYSMGSKGKVFHIAENTGIMKYILYKNSIKYQTIPPTVIKKYAVGKGNAKKEEIYTGFIKETKVDLCKLLGYTKKLGNPITDICDSFYIAKYSFTLT